MKDKYDTSESFPDGTPKTDEEPPLLKIINRIGGSIFKLNESVEDIRKEIKDIRKLLAQLKEAIHEIPKDQIFQRQGEN